MKFNTDGLEFMINEVRNRKFDEFSDDDKRNGRFENGIAVLEYDYIDIELNVCSGSADLDGPDDYTNTLLLDYFICVRGINSAGKKEWADCGYLEADVDVDWNADDWRDQLKADMEKNLADVAAKYNLSYSKPNWKGDEHSFDIFYRFNGINK